MINIRDIYAFLELVEQCNFNTAAEKLFLTQSGLSRKIVQLEGQVNKRLFERTTRFVRPTPEGLLLAKYWTEAIERYQAGLKAIHAGDEELSGLLSVGVSASSRFGAWQDLSEKFIGLYPKITSRIESLTSQDVIAHVKSDDLQVGFCGGAVDEPTLGAICIERIPYRVMLPVDHPLAIRETIKLLDLIGQPLVLVHSHTWMRLRKPLNEVLEANGMLKQVTNETHFFDIQLRLIAENGLIGIHPVSRHHLVPAGVKVVDISDLTLSLDNHFIWKKSSTSPLVRALVNFVNVEYSTQVYD